MSITTKTGDDGTTSFLSNERVPKDHPRIECLGTLDELNAFLGAARSAAANSRSGEIIQTIQRDLFVVCGIIAGSMAPVPGTAQLDGWIAELETALPVLRNFVTPGANPISARLHIARTICRRAERRIVSMDRAETVPPELLRYMNRLSDLLFLLARAEEK
ncbi:ATP--cob(I)alamin adenosyltransferase [Spirochaetia bacterium]|nr:ATP--cob(I)alamin adenosyltransferase [Spirochaetia bacterium]